jgi:hypothetical protein
MSQALVEAPRMARKKMDTVQVRLTTDVADSARIVAAFRGEQMSDFLSDLLRPILRKMEDDEMDKRAAGRPGPGAEPAPPARPKRGGKP